MVRILRYVLEHLDTDFEFANNFLVKRRPESQISLGFPVYCIGIKVPVRCHSHA